jgi:hypothetical protein
VKREIRAIALAVAIVTSCGTFFEAGVQAADVSAKVKFKNDSGEFDLVGDKSAGSLTDNTGKVQATFTVMSDGKLIRIDEGGKPTGYVTMVAPKWKINDAARKELFSLKQQPDGDYKLKDAVGQELFKIKGEPYGLKVEDRNKQPVYKVHTNEDKMSLKSADGKVVLSTKSKVDKMALACFGLDVLSKSQKAALAYAFSFLGK